MSASDISPIPKGDIDDLSDLLESFWERKRGFYKLFSTDHGKYLYDPGSNKLLSCEIHEFELLKLLLESDRVEAIKHFREHFGYDALAKASESIKNAIRNESVLRITEFNNFGLFPSAEDINYRITHDLGLLRLEVTDKCNLSCRYCVYDENNKVAKKKHGSSFMTEQTAYAAIDYLYDHSAERKDIAIGFYGGEPLLNFRIIQNAVKYAIGRRGDKTINFTITTNATLITAQIADFLRNYRFSVLVSIDGPSHYHDLWRVDTRNRGSYERSARGFRTLLDSYMGNESMIGINAVYAPPYSEGKLDELEDFFFKTSWMPSNPRVSVTYPADGSMPLDSILRYGLYKGEDHSLINWARDKYYQNYPDCLDKNPLAKLIVDKSLAHIMKRPLLQKNFEKLHLNGCCLPGSRKVYVLSDGILTLCERVGDAPPIGDIENGANFDTLDKIYLDEYAQKSIRYCSHCWMARLCDICYAHVFTDNSYDPQKKMKRCEPTRRLVEERLIFLSRLLERDYRGLDYLYEYE
ncbi:MAG: radical SAM protein, partial [Thermoplasmata archaeon]|nr:radical SAM protein [Thermoplasmata archaeon]